MKQPDEFTHQPKDMVEACSWLEESQAELVTKDQQIATLRLENDRLSRELHMEGAGFNNSEIATLKAREVELEKQLEDYETGTLSDWYKARNKSMLDENATPQGRLAMVKECVDGPIMRASEAFQAVEDIRDILDSHQLPLAVVKAKVLKGDNCLIVDGPLFEEDMDVTAIIINDDTKEG